MSDESEHYVESGRAVAGEVDGWRSYDVAADDRVSEQVIAGVAAVSAVDPMELEPLYDAVDPDALDALFGETGGGPRFGGQVEFYFGGCEVLVRNGEQVLVRPAR